MREKGTVIEISDGTARVNLVPEDAGKCGSCHACDLGRDEKQEHIIEVPATAGLTTGDEVFIEVPLPSRYLSIVLFFVLPLIFLGAGCVAGYFIGKALFEMEFAADLFTIILGAVGLALSYIIVRVIDKYFLGKRTPPRIVQQ
ncbi:MAG: SoxR reducing system RseC family protein [Planctomycetota bacterium]